MPQIDDAQIQSWCLFEDQFFWVCNKPRGIAVQQGTGTEQSLDVALKHYSARNNRPLIRLGHRLDKDTTGVLVCPKTRDSAEIFRQQMHDKKIDKTYIAVMHGWVCQTDGEIKRALHIDGKLVKATSRYHIIKTTKKYTVAVLQAVTGRKRQLRSHCRALNTQTPVSYTHLTLPTIYSV